jgi:NADPH:quinone reductase-like Zn-dependent oxidoreductase
MKAAVRTGYGPPEVVRVCEVDKPTPGRHELLVKVHASTVNRTDSAYRSGTPVLARPVYGLRKPRAAILGCEFAGVVEATGGGATRFQIGDRVFGYNEGPFGGHAEYLSIHEDRPIARIPDDVSYEEAAPSTEGSHYALTLIDGARIRPGQDVLVNGATGGIGSAAVQLLRVLGARVTAVCATAHLDLVRGLGADRVIDFTSGDFTSDDRTYDAVIDAVGKSSFGSCRRLLKPHGVYLSTELGSLGQNPVLALAAPLSRGRKVRFPIPKIDQAMVRRLATLIETGRFKPVIDHERPLDQIVEAHRYVETGQKIGNVVISIAPPTSA